MSFVVRERQDENASLLNAIDDVVGKSGQAPPSRFTQNKRAGSRMLSDLLDRILNFGKQELSKARDPIFVEIHAFEELALGQGVPGCADHLSLALASRKTSSESWGMTSPRWIS